MGATGQLYETLAICHSLDLARAAFDVAIEEKPDGLKERRRGRRHFMSGFDAVTRRRRP
jgi:hypothetical protein